MGNIFGLGTLWTPESKRSPPHFTPKSVLIAVMGMTGAGKTTFISKTTNTKMEIGHGLESCTKEIQIASYVQNGQDVHLIDTPGFDDTELTDTDVLVKIATYLRGDLRLSGILYLHPMTANRVGGAAARNLRMFQNLVGADNMGNVKLITTMWDKVSPKEGEQRLADLENNFWRQMLINNAQMDKCHDATIDGGRIINSILDTSQVTLQFQREMQNGLAVKDTSAGQILMGELEKLRKKYEEDMKELRKQLAHANMHLDTVVTLREEYEQNSRKQEEIAEQSRKLQETNFEKLRKELNEVQNSWRCTIL